MIDTFCTVLLRHYLDSSSLCAAYFCTQGFVNFCLLRKKARLAACGNILPGVTSVYEWQGKIETETEVSLILKTKADKTEELTKFVVENHPYDTPCVVFVPVEAGHQSRMNYL